MRQGRSTEGDDALRKSVVRPKRSSTEDRKLGQVVVMAARCPGEFSEALRARLPEVLPESAQRDLVLALLAASDEGLRDASGGVDVHALADRLNEEQDRMLREALVDETLLGGDEDRAKIVGDLVGDFARRQSAAQETDLRRRMSEPDADPVALLRERDEMLRRKREQLHPSARAQTQA
jgi:hypothetical protein